MHSATASPSSEQVFETSTPQSQTRSPPLRRSPRLNPPTNDSGSDGVYLLTIDCRLKDTVSQRISSTRRLGTHSLTGDDWGSIKSKIWIIIQSHIKKQAKFDDTTRTWSVCDENPSMEMFDSYVSLRHKTRILTPCDENEARRFLVKYRGETLTLSVYKWGHDVCTSEHLVDFQKQCIQPMEADRSGAGSESSLRDIMDRLKQRWGNILQGQDISWRLWANSILRLPRHKHHQEIQKPMPSTLVRFFKPVSTTAQDHLQRLQRNASLASDVVRSMLVDIESIQADHEMLRTKLVATHAMLIGKQRIIEGFMNDMDPHPTDTDVLMALSLVPDQEDIDHNTLG